MRMVILILLAGLVTTDRATAEKAPLSPEALRREANLIVVGEIEHLRIETERSRFESGFGNYDWAIYLTIKVDAVEKGALTEGNVEVRCFRIKSRRSRLGFLTPSGNHPIPAVGTRVRAYLQGVPGAWTATFPNGLTSPDPDKPLEDAAQVKQLHAGRFTHGLPAESWLLLGVVGIPAVLISTLLLRRLKRKRIRAGSVVSSSPGDSTPHRE